MEVAMRLVNDTIVVEVGGSIDALGCPKLEGADYFQNPMHDAILDMSDVDYIDSMGLGLLVRLMRMMKEHGREFVVAAPSDSVTRGLKMTRLDMVLYVAPTVEVALQRMAKAVTS